MNSGFGIDKAEIDNIFRIYHKEKKWRYINAVHKDIQGLTKKLKIDLNSGISSHTLEIIRQAFDHNFLFREPMPSFWFFVKDVFGDEILQNLCIFGNSPFTENPGYEAFDGIGIVIAISVIVITTVVINYNKEQKFKQLISKNLSCSKKR